jgi:predicted nucleotidyltransferase
MNEYFDYLISKEKYFKNYLKYAKNLKEIAKKILKDKKLKIIIFGSVIERDYTLSSDIDIMIISSKIPRKGIKRAKILGKIYNSIGIASPFEIHLVNKKDWKIYKKFIKKFKEV